MPRNVGMIQTTIWKDRDFLGLPKDAQRLYMFFLSQDDLNHAGLLPLRTRRWGQMASDENASETQEALNVLVERRFVLIDEDTEEVLIRTFVRNDGVWKQPKVMMKLVYDAQQITSPKLRTTFLAELDRVPIDEISGKDEETRKRNIASVAASIEAIRKAIAYPSERVCDTPPKGYAEPLAEGTEGVCDTPRVYARAVPPSTFHLPPSPIAPRGAAESAPRDSAIQKTLDLATTTDPPPDKPETFGQRVNRLTRVYTDVIKLTKFEAVRGIVNKAVQSGYTDDQITTALASLHQKPEVKITADVLRSEITGKTNPRKPQMGKLAGLRAVRESEKGKAA